MWETPRQDGKKKLRRNAVPTIFPISEELSQTRKDENIEESITSNEDYPEIVNDSSTLVDGFQSCDQANTFLSSTDSNDKDNTSMCAATTSSTSHLTVSTLECPVEQIKLLQQKLQLKEKEVKEVTEKAKTVS